MISLIMAMALAGAGVEQGEEPTASPYFSVEEWKSLPERQRAIDVIGGIEALLLAASGPGGNEIGIDQACLGTVNLVEIIDRLMKADVPGTTPFTMAVLEVSECNR